MTAISQFVLAHIHSLKGKRGSVAKEITNNINFQIPLQNPERLKAWVETTLKQRGGKGSADERVHNFCDGTDSRDYNVCIGFLEGIEVQVAEGGKISTGG